MNKPPYVGICVPTGDMVHTAFASDMVYATSQWIRDGGDCAMFISQGTVLVSQRTELVLKARKEGCSHVLWVDSDMRFPPDTISRLLAHGQLVVGANCARRRMPTSPTAANYVNGKKQAVFTEADSHGLEKVDALGTGVLLVQMEVFDSIPAPWFATPWDSKAQGYQGEDMYFCWLLRQCGVPVYVDHDLSREISHVGQFEFRHEHTWLVREEKQREEAKAAEPFELAVEA